MNSALLAVVAYTALQLPFARLFTYKTVSRRKGCVSPLLYDAEEVVVMTDGYRSLTDAFTNIVEVSMKDPNGFDENWQTMLTIG